MVLKFVWVDLLYWIYCRGGYLAHVCLLFDMDVSHGKLGLLLTRNYG